MTRQFVENINTLSQDFVGELLSRQAPIRQSVALEMFAPDLIDTPDGEVPWIPPEFRTPNSGSNYVGKIGLSEDPVPIEIDIDNVTISTDGKFSREAQISRHADMVMSQLDSAEGLVGYLGSIVRGFNNVEVDVECQAVLSDTTKNATVDVSSGTSKWTSHSSAEPFDNIETAMDTVRGAGEMPDTYVAGLDVMRELARTKAVLSAVGERSISATGDVVAYEAVVEALRSRFGFDNVLVDNSVWVNDANKQAAPNLNRVYDGTNWIGSSDHLIVREQEEMGESDSGYDSRSQDYWTLDHRVVDFYRGENDAGVILQNAI